MTAGAHRYLPNRRLDGVVVTDAGDEVLVYDTEQHHIHHLNPTAATVWRLCDGQHDLDQLATLATAALDGDVDVDAVANALHQLRAANLLQPSDSDVPTAPTLSRRKLVRGVAIAGAVAAPLVASTQAASAGKHHSTTTTTKTWNRSAAPGAASLDQSFTPASTSTSIAGSPCEPGKGQCVVEPYDAWVCYPTSATAGLCGAADGAPSLGVAMELEQQLLVDGGFLAGEADQQPAEEQQDDAPQERVQDEQQEEAPQDGTGSGADGAGDPPATPEV